MQQTEPPRPDEETEDPKLSDKSNGAAKVEDPKLSSGSNGITKDEDEETKLSGGSWEILTYKVELRQQIIHAIHLKRSP